MSEFRHVGCGRSDAATRTTKDSVKDAETAAAADEAMRERFRRTGSQTCDSLRTINKQNREVWSNRGGAAA